MHCKRPVNPESHSTRTDVNDKTNTAIFSGGSGGPENGQIKVKKKTLLSVKIVNIFVIH